MRNRKLLLTVDAVVNLLLGVGLVVFPRELVAALGIPAAVPAFYPSILGGVLFGVGVALLLERFRPPLSLVGLGWTVRPVAR